MSRLLPPRPSLILLKKQARQLRRAVAAGQSDACQRVKFCHPAFADTPLQDIARTDLSLRDAQLVIAREYGFENWAALKNHVQEETQKVDAETRMAGRIRTCTSTEEEIAQAVQAACGSAVQRAERITKGFSNEVYRITTTDGQNLTYRANWYCAVPHFENEKWALKQCANAGVPAPRVLSLVHDLPGHPQRSVCVTTYLEGRTLQSLVEEDAISTDAFHALLYEVGAIYGKLHRVPTDGFGQLNGHGKGKAPGWRSAYASLDMDRLRQSADNAGLPWSLIEEALQMLEDGASHGDGVAPCLLHGDWKLEHIIVHEGKVSGLIDFEHCEGGDPARETDWSAEAIAGWWDAWDAFTGKPSIPVPTKPLIEGYGQTGEIDDTFMQRSKWFRLWGSLGGLSYHGVQDVNTAGMMAFLNWRFREDLERARWNL